MFVFWGGGRRFIVAEGAQVTWLKNLQGKVSSARLRPVMGVVVPAWFIGELDEGWEEVRLHLKAAIALR